MVPVLACSDAAPPAEPTPPITFSTHSSASLLLRHTALDAASIADTGTRLESARARIVADVGLTSMPRVTVTLHPTRESLRAAITPSVGTVPAFASGFLTSSDSVHILSPNLSSQWGYDTGLVAIVHELAHCVSMQLNPTIANNPRWLWETFALYQAGQIVDPRRVPALAGGTAPSFVLLNNIQDPTIYDVGGVLGEFVVTTWGRETLVSLVRNNGNVAQAAGVDPADFLTRWMAFVRDRYF
jgi:hypothetical protein